MDQLPPLPETSITFENAPVSEVALAVQLAEPVTDDAFTLGSFWPKIQSRYPGLEPQPPLPPMLEQFDASAGPSVSFQLLDRPAGRYWLLSQDQTELVQVQPDRFAYNWRQEPAEAEYPRYERLRESFFDLYSSFVATCADDNRTVTPTWCEITYINPIEVESSEGRPDLSTVLKRLRPVELRGLGAPGGHDVQRAVSASSGGRALWSFQRDLFTGGPEGRQRSPVRLDPRGKGLGRDPKHGGSDRVPRRGPTAHRQRLQGHHDRRDAPTMGST